MDCSFFAMLCWFLLYNEVTQLYVHISPLPLGPLSHPSLHPHPTPLSSVQFSRSGVSNSFWPHGLQHTSLSLSIANSQNLLKFMSIESVMPPHHLILCCPLLLLPSIFPASGSFPMSQFFASCGQSTGVSVSASVLLLNIQDWFPLEWTGWISLQSKGLSRVFSNTTVQKCQFFGAHLSL